MKGVNSMRTQPNNLLIREVAKRCMILVAILVSAGVALAAQGNPGIAPINSRITEVKTYAELGAEWWQWALQAPGADSPLFDTTGAKCRVGQRGPVWFLASTLGFGDLENQTVRQCDVPAGKAIFFPVINAAYLAFLQDPEETRTAAYVRTTVQNLCDSNSIRGLSVKIDGVEVARPAKFVTTPEQSPLFQLQLPTDNIYGASADPDDPNVFYIQELMLSPSAHKGFYIYLKPLSTGSHTVEWTATWDCDFDFDGTYSDVMSENIKYELNVLSGVSGQVQ